MYILIDLIPKSGFFISVALSDTQLLSFDNTLGQQRVIKQVLVSRSTKKTKPRYRYRTLEVVNGKPKRIIRAAWAKVGTLDVVNGQVWKTIWSKKMDREVGGRLSKFSRSIYKNLRGKRKLKSVLMRLDGYLFALISAQKR